MHKATRSNALRPVAHDIGIFVQSQTDASASFYGSAATFMLLHITPAGFVPGLFSSGLFRRGIFQSAPTLSLGFGVVRHLVLSRRKARCRRNKSRVVSLKWALNTLSSDKVSPKAPVCPLDNFRRFTLPRSPRDPDSVCNTAVHCCRALFTPQPRRVPMLSDRLICVRHSTRHTCVPLPNGRSYLCLCARAFDVSSRFYCWSKATR